MGDFRLVSAEAPSTSGAGGEAGGTADDADLTYDDMLDRVYEQIHANNPELTDRKKFKMKPPQVMRVGSTRTCWVNFTEICKMYAGVLLCLRGLFTDIVLYTQDEPPARARSELRAHRARYYWFRRWICSSCSKGQVPAAWRGELAAELHQGGVCKRALPHVIAVS